MDKKTPKRKSLETVNVTPNKVQKISPLKKNKSPAIQKNQKTPQQNQKTPQQNQKTPQQNQKTPQKNQKSPQKKQINGKQNTPKPKPVMKEPEEEEEEDEDESEDEQVQNGNEFSIEDQDDSDDESDQDDDEDEEQDDEDEEEQDDEDEEQEQDDKDEQEEDDEDEEPKQKPSIVKQTPNKPNTEKTQEARKYSLFIGGMDFRTTEEQIREHFNNTSILFVRILRNPINKKSRGLAFINFKDEASQQTGLEKDGSILDGRTIRVNLPREFDPNASLQRKKVVLESLKRRIELLEKEIAEEGDNPKKAKAAFQKKNSPKFIKNKNKKIKNN